MPTPGPDDQTATQSSGAEFLFEHTTDCIVEGSVQDGDPIVYRVNDAFENVFGYTNSELRGENLNDFITPEGKRDEVEAVDEAIRNGNIGPREVTRQTADGPRDFLLRATGGEGDLSYAIYTDITAQKERERQLQRERDRLDEFVSIVSHDLRNPLNIAKGGVQLAHEECDTDHLDAVERALDRMAALIEDLLTLARQGTATIEIDPVDLRSKVKTAWQSVQTPEATLVNEPEATINADPARLLQLLENLLRNAIEHGSEGVTVTVGDFEDGFYIADDGPGIPPEQRDEVFEHGYTSDPNGTGFGLGIVEEIVEAHDWEIRVTESKDGGARFEITGVDIQS